jgi:hypothetical protein
LFQRTKPGDFTTQSLERLVALDDPVAVKRLAVVSPATRDLLFDLDPQVLTSAARSLNEDELAVFAGYLTGLSAQTRQRLLDRVAAEPASLKALTSPRARDAVLASRDQGAALEILLRTNDGDTPEVLQNDLRLAWERQIHPEILWHRHPILVVLSGLAVLILLLLVRRLFRGPRPKKPGPRPQSEISKTEPTPAPKPIGT